MVKKTNSDREDLTHVLLTTISDEGYDVDTDTEREVLRLVKYIISQNNLDEDEDMDDEEFESLWENDEFEDSYSNIDEDNDI